MEPSVYQSYADDILSKAKSAAAAFRSYNQEQVDHIVDAVFKAAFDPVIKLMKAEIVGKPAKFIAEEAGFNVPDKTKLLIAPCKGVGPGHPLSYEILAPILALYFSRQDMCKHSGNPGSYRRDL